MNGRKYDNSVANPSSPRVDATEHSLKYEYDILMEEYRRASDRITRRLEADERGFELTVLAVGSVVAASSLIMEHGAYVLLLVIAVPFHVLIWGQVRGALTRIHLGRYIREVLSPRMDTIIQRTSVEHDEYGEPLRFESWEGYLRSLLRGKPLLESIYPLSSAGKILIQTSAAIVLLTSYMFLRAYDPEYTATVFDAGLLVLNVCTGIVSVFYLVLAVIYSRS